MLGRTARDPLTPSLSRRRERETWRRGKPSPARGRGCDPPGSEPGRERVTGQSAER